MTSYLRSPRLYFAFKTMTTLFFVLEDVLATSVGYMATLSGVLDF